MSVQIDYKPIRSHIDLTQLSSDKLQLLDLELSYKHPSAHWVSATFSSRWDGRIRFLRSTGSIPSGLVPRAIFCLRNAGVDVTVNFEFPQYPPTLQCQFLGELRPYQQQAKESLLKHNQGILYSPVRSGKTVIVAAALAQAQLSPVVILTPQVDIAYQTQKMLSTFLSDTHIGLVGDGNTDFQDITVMTIQSVLAALRVIRPKGKDKTIPPSKYAAMMELLKCARICITDEAHHLAAPHYRTIMSYCSKTQYCWAVSGTPWRADGHDMMFEAIAGCIIHRTSFSDLIQEGYLVPATIFFYPVPPKRYAGTMKYPQIYDDYIVCNPIRNQAIYKFTEQMTKAGKTVLVHVSRIQHGDILERLLQPFGAVFLHGRHTGIYRQAIFDQFRQQQLPCLITTLANEGVDLPCTDACVIAEGGESSILTIQRLRNLTPYPNKQRAYVLDFDDQARYLSGHAKQRRRIYAAEPAFQVQQITDCQEIHLQ